MIFKYFLSLLVLIINNADESKEKNLSVYINKYIHIYMYIYIPGKNGLCMITHEHIKSCVK